MAALSTTRLPFYNGDANQHDFSVPRVSAARVPASGVIVSTGACDHGILGVRCENGAAACGARSRSHGCKGFCSIIVISGVVVGFRSCTGVLSSRVGTSGSCSGGVIRVLSSRFASPCRRGAEACARRGAEYSGLNGQRFSCSLASVRMCVVHPSINHNPRGPMALLPGTSPCFLVRITFRQRF